jgi:uncharacterized membrane protein YoaT (DUF817 family)
MSEAPRGHSRFLAVRARLEAMAVEPGPRGWFLEFLVFGFKQGWACLFGALMLGLLLGTHLFWPESAPIHRYDAITIGAVSIQLAMLAFRLETPKEAIVILIFHIVGTVMELFKTAAGSWQYPEGSLLHIGAVPLFSGFMYAAVGSYIIQAWRLFDLRIRHHPPYWMANLMALAIYANFFTHHYIGDFRWYLGACILGLYARTTVLFRPLDRDRSMPLLLAFVLIGFFIWLAENIATFYGIWSYPHQMGAWATVHLGKWSSWSLLAIMSFTIVAGLKHIKAAIHIPE